MAVQRPMTCLLAMAMLIQLATAATYTVGGPNGGWNAATDLKTWAGSQNFVVGDNLVFQYGSSHDVSEVSKSDYDSCQASNAIQTETDGNTVIKLSSPGKRYFICGTPGHCSAGMKVEIDTLAATSPATAPAPAPESPSTLPPSQASPGPETSSAATSPASPALQTTPPPPLPAESPVSSSTVSPVSPSTSPLSGSPPSPDVSEADSPSTSTPPIGVASPLQPSSAVNVVNKITIPMGFSFAIIMLLSF